MHPRIFRSRLPLLLDLRSILEIQHPNRASDRFPETPDDPPDLPAVPGDFGRVRGDPGHTHFRMRAVRWPLRHVELEPRATAECRGDIRTRFPDPRTVSRGVRKSMSAPPGVPFRLSAGPSRLAGGRSGPCGEPHGVPRDWVRSSGTRGRGGEDKATEDRMRLAPATSRIERPDISCG
jgi:hypothetical protein